MNAITMREMQKLSASTIAALPHAVPVKSGATTVALLIPIRKASPDLVARVMAEVDAAAAARHPEDTARLAALVGEDPP